MRRLVLLALTIVVAAALVVLASAATDRPSKTATSTVETTAPVDTVWEVLTDFSSYEEWNPFVVSASGQAREGDKLELAVKRPGEATQDVTADVVIVRTGRKLRWQARLVAPGIRDREYEFLIGVVRPGELVVQGKVRLEGVLVPFSDLDGYGQGLEMMLEALVARAESQAGSGQT